MDAPALRFVEEPYHFNDIGNMLQLFRDQGFVVLEEVFKPDTVDAYREQLYALIRAQEERGKGLSVPDDVPHAIWPAKAPRLRDMVRRSLWPNYERVNPTLFHPSWLIHKANPSAPEPEGWHRDGDHNVAQFGNVYYHYPLVVHVNMYFEDLTLRHGPTHVIPRSHRVGDLSPFNGSPSAPLACRKGDVVLWDQRLWHRGSVRREEGLRIAAIFGFHASHVHRFGQTPAQAAAFAAAENEAEKILFGGCFE